MPIGRKITPLTASFRQDPALSPGPCPTILRLIRKGPWASWNISGNQINLRAVSCWRTERVSLRVERSEKDAGAMGTGASLSVPISIRNFRTASHAEVKRALGRYVAAAGWSGGGGGNTRACRAPSKIAAGRPKAELCLGEGLISNESPLREVRTLGSRCGER